MQFLEDVWYMFGDRGAVSKRVTESGRISMEPIKDKFCIGRYTMYRMISRNSILGRILSLEKSFMYIMKAPATFMIPSSQPIFSVCCVVSMIFLKNSVQCQLLILSANVGL